MRSLPKGAGVWLGLGCLAVGLGALPADAEVSGVPAGGPSLGTVINGVGDGVCSSGACAVSGGTGAGGNLFHRFGAFDTRGGISGVSIQSGGYQNVIVGVMSTQGSFIDKTVSLSAPGNLFWLSPGGIQMSGAGGFANVQHLQLSSATGLRIGGGVFDALGTPGSELSALSGEPMRGHAGLLSDPVRLTEMVLTNNGDISVSNGLLTLDQSLLLDSQGGNVLLESAQLESPVIGLSGQSVIQNGGIIRAMPSGLADGSLGINGAARFAGSVTAGTLNSVAGSSIRLASGGSLQLESTSTPSIILGSLTLEQGVVGPALVISSGAVAQVHGGFQQHAGSLAGAGNLVLYGTNNLWTDGIWSGDGTTSIAPHASLVLRAPNLPVQLKGRSVQVLNNGAFIMNSYANVTDGSNAITIDSGGLLSFQRAPWTADGEPTDTGFFADNGRLDLLTSGSLVVGSGVRAEFYSYGSNAHILWTGTGLVQIAGGSSLRLYGDIYNPNFANEGAVANLAGSISVGSGGVLASTNSLLRFVANPNNNFLFDGALVVNGGSTEFDFSGLASGAAPSIGSLRIIDGIVGLRAAPSAGVAGSSVGLNIGSFNQSGGILTDGSDFQIGNTSGLGSDVELQDVRSLSEGGDQAVHGTTDGDAELPRRSSNDRQQADGGGRQPSPVQTTVQVLSADQVLQSYQGSEDRSLRNAASGLGLMSQSSLRTPTINQIQTLLQGIELLMRGP